jgi:hypothetical protein
MRVRKVTRVGHMSALPGVESFFIESYNLAKFGAVQFNHLHVLDAMFRENITSLPRSPRFVSFHG